MAAHLLIKDTALNGWEYGMLRSFENAIIKETGAAVMELPAYTGNVARWLPYFGQGMNRGVYRKYFPKQELSFTAEVAWYILMGPENYRLDICKNWQAGAKTKILYLYDTLPSQYPLIKRLFSNNTWDILITSFNDAVDDLEKLTGRKWHCVEQAADDQLFKPIKQEDRVIHFSSYGRRYPVLHEAVKEFCAAKNLYYDYTTHDAKHPVADATELYRQYAWHLTHSMFTFSWPVELTNPQRAGHLHPITCRWFEAAAAGTIMLGQAPANPVFNKWLDEGLVISIDPAMAKNEILARLDQIWEGREALFLQANTVRKKDGNSQGWNERARRILSFIQ